ncbi:cytochrome c oxidase subunit II [Paracoccus onubensis]|uniref:cytochrome c oxidase subunit II n=1 Tax=Paracoccus onubensis TaxID=1675788 RepID=UPI00272F07E2|nr:cytochrome c oxidase subunit II [Paracoccus onubensis]MDP0926840.1 cytochrome c oxidase subunit II [Paracoccus onubensis]
MIQSRPPETTALDIPGPVPTERPQGPRCIRQRILASVLLLAGCEGPQSALVPAGVDAQALHLLFTTMLGGAIVLWLLMNGFIYWFSHRHPAAFSEIAARWLIVLGGVVTPAIMVGALLVWGLTLLPDQRIAGNGLRIRVHGEQWWWRVAYQPPGTSGPIISANEIRLPAGRRTEFILTSDRVIHSFWIPALGGKMDMFPGRETRMSLQPETPGRYRGQCAEFCGASHAWMAFEAVVMPPEEFDAWLKAEAKDARPPQQDSARKGQQIFRREGCGACHTLRGTEAVAQVGPDLTHIGNRHSIGAGRLGATLDDIALWVRHTGDLKPEVHMPAFPHLEPAELRDLASYLKGLK